MADLLTETDKTFFQNVMGDIFDTFKRTITIHKEPQKIIKQVNADLYAGYGDTSSPDNVEYVPVSKDFDAMITYLDRQNKESDPLIGTNFSRGEARIKVQKEARNYINNGKTIKIDVDGKPFNLITDDSVKDFFGTQYYVYHLEAAN